MSGASHRGGRGARFAAVVGNPPYHADTRGTSDLPLYPRFVDVAHGLAPVACLVTPARFLFDAGKTSKKWNRRMLDDPCLRVVAFERASTRFFPGVELKGGVAVTVRDLASKAGPISTFTPYPELNSIVRKVRSHPSFVGLVGRMVPQLKFDLGRLYGDRPDLREHIGSGGKERRLTTSIFTLPNYFREEPVGDDVAVVGLWEGKRAVRWVPRAHLASHLNLDAYKVVLPKSNGTGRLGEPLSSPMVAGPGVGYTQSFIGIGAFRTEAEACRVLKYLVTGFARVLLGSRKVTQDNNPQVWENVPDVFGEGFAGVDWEASVGDVDAQLMRMFGLSGAERRFVAERAEPVEAQSGGCLA